jgi:hypothetical protein
VKLHETATRRVAGDFLRHLIEAVPYKVHTVLTDAGTHLTTPGNVASAPSSGRRLQPERPSAPTVSSPHGARNDIDHRLTKPCHPWTNGQVERMNRKSRARRSSATAMIATSKSAPIWPTSSAPTPSHAA